MKKLEETLLCHLSVWILVIRMYKAGLIFHRVNENFCVKFV